MTSRERVERAIRRLPVDRMPIDLGCHFSTGISVFAYRNLRRYLGLSEDKIEMIDCYQMLARVDEDVLDRFHIDTILLNPPYPGTHPWNPREDYIIQVPDSFTPERMADGGWALSTPSGKGIMPAGGFFMDGGGGINHYAVGDDERLKLFARRAEKIYKETDRFTMYMGYSAFFDGIEFACDMIEDPEGCKAMFDERLKRQTARFDAMNKALGKYIGAIEVNSDLGMQSAPMVRPELYREICTPYLKAFCKHVHDTSDIKVFIHSCGAIEPLIPYIIEAGVDILNPVQISAAGMEPRALKQKYGGQICFWGGGCDTQTTLWQAGPDEVSAHVRGLVETFAPGSGFVFNQVHNVMGNVPPENIEAMLDTAYACSLELGAQG